MKKLFAALLFIPALSWGWMGLGGGTDYSRDAGNSYYCANAAGTSVTTAAGLNIANPALALYNPNGSGKNLTVLDVGVDVTASPGGAVAFYLAYNVSPSSGPTAGTVGTTTAALIGKSTTTASGLCYITGQLPNQPKAFRYIGSVTGASSISPMVLVDQTNGKVVVPPGATISLQTSAAAAVLAHIVWREDNL